jgi:hypothetical protein
MEKEAHMKKTMKKAVTTTIAGLVLILLMTIPAGATDYQAYSLDELNRMQGTMATASSAERDAFSQARQTKMQALTPEERNNLRAGSDNGKGQNLRARDGSGSMHRYQKHDLSTGSRTGAGGQHRGGRR